MVSRRRFVSATGRVPDDGASVRSCIFTKLCELRTEKTTTDNESIYDEKVINTILKNFYVDNCLKSVQTEDDAIQLIRDLGDACGEGGFHLTKWISNNRVVLENLESVPECERAKEVKDLDLDHNGLQPGRVLGVQWCVETDTFTFKIPRAELTAATVSVHINKMTMTELEIRINDTLFWTDSLTVRKYIKNETTRFHTFVINRANLVREGSALSQWRYVDTKSNPRDDVSRGLSADALSVREKTDRVALTIQENEQAENGIMQVVQRQSVWEVVCASPAPGEAQTSEESQFTFQVGSYF